MLDTLIGFGQFNAYVLEKHKNKDMGRCWDSIRQLKVPQLMKYGNIFILKNFLFETTTELPQFFMSFFVENWFKGLALSGGK